MREGDVVAGWTLEDRLGEGGTSTVWRVRNGERRGVLKVLRAELRGEVDWRARLLREADALRAVKHENVVALLDAGTTDDDEPFVVMPEVEGETLRARIDREGKLAPKEAWRVLRPIAEALAAAHDAGIVHRDMKPDNVVLSSPPKLVDFGLARGEGVPKVTATGAPVGTPAYMAPEQWWNHGVGPPVDQYALGVTLFEAIAGRAPFDDASFAELVSSHVSKAAPRLETRVAKRSEPRDRGARGAKPLEHDAEAIADFVATLLAKDPKERFSSMRDAIAAGDVAFGAPTSRVRFSPASLFFVVYGVLSLVLFGYPRASTLGEWFRGSGWGIFVTLGAFALGAAWITLRAGARGRSALIVAAAGTFATASGFQAVFRTLRATAPEEGFALFHQGAWEAQANRYVGFTLAAALFFAAEVRRTRPPSARARVASMATLVVAGAAVTLGAPSSAIAIAALAFAFVMPRTPATLAAVACASLAAITRAHALGDAAWSLEPTRAARAVALATASHELSFAWLAGLLASIGAALYVGRGIREIARAPRAWLALGAVWAIADAALATRVTLAKRAIYTQLEPEFSLLSQLDPPPARAKPTPLPPLRPTLKVARDRVAIDDKPALVLSALEGDAGLAVLRTDIAHRLAAEPARNGEVDLLLMADASISPAVVTMSLRAAHDAGVRHVGILLLRGEPPARAVSIEEDEASYVLPRDFDVLDVRIALGGAPLEGRTFGDALRTVAAGDAVDVSR